MSTTLEMRLGQTLSNMREGKPGTQGFADDCSVLVLVLPLPSLEILRNKFVPARASLLVYIAAVKRV